MPIRQWYHRVTRLGRGKGEKPARTQVSSPQALTHPSMSTDIHFCASISPLHHTKPFLDSQSYLVVHCQTFSFHLPRSF